MIRFLDIFFSLLGLILVLPVFAVVIPILRLTGEGEVFYRQTRVGRNQVPFSLLKFATMLKNSPNLATGDITIKDDFRILKAGRILRATKINELPQIWNILKGDMSLVGPRPMTIRNFDYYTEPARRAIQSARPGLTGIGSIVFRDEERILNGMDDKVEFYRSVIAPYKGELEIWYIKNLSLSIYFSVLILTAIAVIFPRSTLYRAWFRNLPEMPVALREVINR